MKVLVFAPHPDDDLIGCGGSLAKHVKEGHEVTVVYMTSGEAGSLKYSKDELGKIREKEAKKASKILGIKETIFLRNPDGQLKYNRENLLEIIDLLREKRANLVYVPHDNDAHQDHIKTYELIAGAIGKEPCSINKILCYEVWTPLQNISYVENITEFIELKIKALKQHQSQIQEFHYDEAVRGLNRYRGVMTGEGQYCECFQYLNL